MKSRSRFFDAIFIFTLLTIVYSFFYSGTFIIDDEHILASRALSFAFEGDFNNSRVLGNDRVFEYATIPEPWSNQALNIEPAQAVAAGVLALLSTLLNDGRIQSMFLLNIWVTAATASIVYLSVAKLGYPRKVIFLVTVLFGLGTIAMPYTRTFFRDPLAMFFLTATWYVAILIRQTNQQEHSDPLKTSTLWIVLIGLFTAGVLSKNSVLLALPILLLEIALHPPQRKEISKRKPGIKKWLVPLLIFTGLILCWFLIIPAIPMLTRFSPNYYFSVLNKFLVIPRNGMVQALLGPFISSGKSIFIFSPVLLLGLWSLLFRFRSSWAAWLYLVLLVIFQALFYGAEWAGHVNWGLRFVLPAIPLLALTAAPAIDSLIKKRRGTLLLVGMLAFSFIIQVAGSLIPIRQFYLDMLNAVPPVSEYSTIWSMKASVLNWSLNWIFTAQPLDLAIFRNPYALWWIIPVSIIVISLVFVGLKFRKLQWMILAAFFLTIFLNFGMVSLYHNDVAYSSSRTDFKQSQEFINNQYQPGDLVLVKPYSEDIWNFWMNWGNPSIAWTSLPFVYPSPEQIANAAETGNPEPALNETTLWIFIHQLPTDSRVWLITDQNSPTADYDFEGQWLAGHAGTSDCRSFIHEPYSTRVCFFEFNLK